jgi:hypothetical protein
MSIRSFFNFRSRNINIYRALSSKKPNTVATEKPFNSYLSNKNAILVKNIPPSTTLGGLMEKLKDLDKKSVDLQPGCSLHFVEEADALRAADHLSSNLKVQVRISYFTKFVLLY